MTSLFAKAWKNRDGMAATEFALLVPVMVTLFFGVLELSDAMTMNRRVAIASNTVVDIAAQTEEITPNQVNSLIDGIAPILEPADTLNLNIKLISVIVDDDDNPRVHWSLEWQEDNDAGTNNMKSEPPYAEGDLYPHLSTSFVNDPDGLVRLENRSLLVLEMDFPFTPRFAGWFVSDPINFERYTKRAPRLNPRVQLCDNSGNNCTT